MHIILLLLTCKLFIGLQVGYKCNVIGLCQKMGSLLRVLPESTFAKWYHVLLRNDCTIVTYINIKYCCSTSHAVNYRRELVLENEIWGSSKVLEFQYQKIVGTLVSVVTEGRLSCCSEPVVCVEAWTSHRWFENPVLEGRIVLRRPCQGSDATRCVSIGTVSASGLKIAFIKFFRQSHRELTTSYNDFHFFALTL